jgi:hypothetical protein
MKNKDEMSVKTGEINFMTQNLSNNKGLLIEHFRKMEQALTF